MVFYSRTTKRLKHGVNIYGYAFAEHGVGQSMRRFAQVAREAKLPYAVLPYVETYSRQQARFSDLGAGESVFDINIICVNADTIPRFVEHVGPELLAGRYNIGIWAWEVEDFPESMARSAEFLDEIWGVSRFTAKAIAGSVSCPVLPCPNPVPVTAPVVRTRAELRLSEDFLFLFALDFNSILDRKNPLAVVAAFKKAFSPKDPVQLVIKTINGNSFPSQLLRLNCAAAGHPGILVVDGYLPAAEQNALMNACDAYVSLHRSEGFGFTLAEAMALGKPVIGTAYSGNLDFMTEENSYLVPYEMVSVGEGSAPYPADSRWANPDVDEAARLMRTVFEDPKEAQAKAERGRQEIENRHTPAARAKFVVQRLNTIRKEFAGTWSKKGPFKVLGFDDKVFGPDDSEVERLEGMDGSEFIRAHREFDDVGQLLRGRLVEFEENRVVPNLVCGTLDGIRTEDDGATSIWGWAHDPRSQGPARAVVLLIDGKQVPLEIQVGVERSDLATVDPNLTNCGWHFSLPGDLLAGDPRSIEAYALLEDGLFGQLPRAQPSAPSVDEAAGQETGSDQQILDEIATCRAELERVVAERDAARLTLDQLLGSRSWKLTAPLRSFFEVLRSG